MFCQVTARNVNLNHGKGYISKWSHET